jgi:hypothetical protein
MIPVVLPQKAQFWQGKAPFPTIFGYLLENDLLQLGIVC